MQKIGAVIVAAGLSSRMKTFKPSLPFGDSTVANHTISKLKKLNIDPITVVVGHKSRELKDSIFYSDIRYVENPNYSETQMFDSVVLGVEDIMNLCDRIMIMPMDLPAILEETLTKVLSIEGELVRTIFDGKPGHPIIITNKFAATLSSYKGNDGLRGAMESYGSPITNVNVDDEAVYFDIDTPEEYEKLIEWNYERGKGYPLAPHIEVSLKARENFFDETAYSLLEAIEEYKSVHKASTSVGISYSKASKIIRDMERELGFSVVEKWTGGAGGGGAVLTEEGRRLKENYINLTREMNKILQRKYKKYFGRGIRR